MHRFLKFVKRKLSKSKNNQQPIQQPQSKLVHSDNPSNQEPATAPAPKAQEQPAPQAQAPLQGSGATAQSSGPTLQVALVNNTSSSNVYCYVTGQAINNNYAVFLLQADGTTPFYPASPSATGSAVGTNCAIPLAAPGNSKTITIPQLVGGRIWFSVDATLTFLINPGPALVEPSVTNQSDPNINISWGFAEFTYNSSQLYANITYVDFVSIPIALSLTNTSGAVSTVQGLPSSGLDTVCSQLQAQSTSDGVAGWRNLIVTSNGKNLRALSPNNGLTVHPGDFSGYFEPYVNQVWQQYTTQTFQVNASSLQASGQVSSSNNELTLSGEAFSKPSTADIFSCNSGPFTTGSDQTRNQLIPQLAAAFNRTTLLETNTTPAPVADYYQNPITNHYARICHATNIDGRGYAFPYDDVEPPAGEVDQSGFVNDGAPKLLTVTVGGPR